MAEEFLLEYDRLYPMIYGEENVTYNVHVLMHREKDSFIGIKHNGNIIPARFLRFETENGTKYVKVFGN